MKNFLRKLLGVYELESHVLRLTAETSKLQAALEIANQRHTKLQSQMITYVIQQRQKEASYEVESVISGDWPTLSFAELAKDYMAPDPILQDLPFKPCNGPLVYNREGATTLRDTFANTVTDRAVASLKVADPLPATHPAVSAQEARNKRYSTVAATDCAAMNIPYSHAVWRGLQDHYDNFSPSWFCPDLVSIGRLRMRAMLLADEQGLDPRPVKTAKRTFVNSYPAPLLIRAQFELHNEAVLNQTNKDQ